ncbi:SprT family zinc-dependent metalloprotease [Ekhidna sp. MALMAid0563]|uniref:M48 family metallopeptidase n=1 Tax=Ekhidna sp. MALMAid0563 TaxID=3143937 RepID=UPI0032DF081C
MPKALYGGKVINYTIEEKDGLKSHYISVDKKDGVVLKGKSIEREKAERMILEKARWIINKLALVQAIEEGDIVTGARLPYLGRRYYVEVFEKEGITQPQIEFNESKFKFIVSSRDYDQAHLKNLLQEFYKEKAIDKIAPRLRKWSKVTGLEFNELKFRFLEKRWGSCTDHNNIIINIDAIKLPYTLIDYLLVHELVHTKVKDHSKTFWAELSKHMPKWKELDDQMYGVKM